MKPPKTPVILVNMPFGPLWMPSLQLGILKSLLNREGIPSYSAHLNLDFFDFFGPKTDCDSISLKEYDLIWGRGRNNIGEWIFSQSLQGKSDPREDLEYKHLLGKTQGFWGTGEDETKYYEKAKRLRERIPDFIAECCNKLLEQNPSVVGFTTTLRQNTPSLALAKHLKKQNPLLRIVFGGANCNGKMGEGLIRAFPWIDVVVRGEAESTAPLLFQELLSDTSLTHQAGLCIREEDTLTVVEDDADLTPVEQIPIPDFGDYFSALKNSEAKNHIDRVRIPYQGSRGCYWGEKKRCTFCGINGNHPLFRAKSARKIEDEINTLATQYEILDFIFVDNVISKHHLHGLMPKIAGGDIDFSFVCETRPNLKRQDISFLHDAGVRFFQPGIESLSTPILKLMNKGTTALANIRLLKWCSLKKIHPIWNLLYGIPGEPQDEYTRMAKQIPSFHHLPCPNGKPVPLRIDRFSPYEQYPELYGISIKGPSPFYKYLFGVKPDLLNDIAYFFEYDYEDGRNTGTYTQPWIDAVATWRQIAEHASPGLTLRRGPQFSTIEDTRFADYGTTHTLSSLESEIYAACEDGAVVSEIVTVLKTKGITNITVRTVEDILCEFVDTRLVYWENDTYLALATRDR